MTAHAFGSERHVLLLVLLVAIAVAFGALVRVSILASGSLWLDELWTLDAVSRSFKEMIGARLISDVHPPIWSMLEWVWLRVVGGYDAAANRLLSLGFGLASIAVPVVAAIRIPSLRPALLVMSGITALSLFPLQFSVELRSYSMLIALGTAATVIWAGLLIGDLAPTWRWIFLFALTGALAGFTHYYGNVLYATEVVVLAGIWAASRRRRELRTLVGWAALSLVPVVSWLVIVRSWFPNAFVADPPNLSILQTWLAYAFGPVSNVVAGHDPGYAYPSGPVGIESLIFLAVVLALVAAPVITLVRRQRPIALDPARFVGLACVAVLILGIGMAWIASLILPPSMTARNLAALLPPLFLATSCAATIAERPRFKWLGGAAVLGVAVAASAIFAWRFGVNSITPTWQQQAGYRAAVEALIAAGHGPAGPALLGLDTSWGWHGQWDSALRSAVAAGPAESGDEVPVAIRWVGTEQPAEIVLPDGPVVFVSDSHDGRETAVVGWLELTRGPCRMSPLGGPGFGQVLLVECPG